MNPEPTLTTLPAFRVVGIETRTDNASEMDVSTARIARLWERFFHEGVMEIIPGKTSDGVPLGVYTDYESDHNGAYTLMIGVETAANTTVPEGMRALEIPSGKYLVFVAEGQMPEALVNMWVHIWDYFSRDVGFRRAYTADFERHESHSRALIHIAIQ